ncbi:nuclear transport factor 2 family protein [Nesterenkonia marinintestina]|uniref:nuclear transport factor 2 family protein n=1 Tax=Nesterenkonia marinintestina TaxID=2979865 RepID=UPI0021BFE97C|nr:nuclear transport factor 2 family protein [Nesterenkonia sp. GX14115]
MTLETDTAALDIVLEYHRAWTGGNIDQAMTQVSDDIVCHAPGETLTGKEAWRDYLRGFAPNLTGLTHVAHFADDGHVALFYYPQTAATNTALAAENFTVREGKIVKLMLVFDRLSYAQPDQTA